MAAGKPIVLMTGSEGTLGSAISAALAGAWDRYIGTTPKITR